MKKLTALLLLLLALFNTFILTACFDSSYDKLVELRELVFDTGGEYAQRLANAKSNIEEAEIAAKHSEKIKEAVEDLRLDEFRYSDYKKFNRNCKISKEDLGRYISTYSVADFMYLKDKACICNEVLFWLFEIYPSSIEIFDFNNKPENIVGGYYYENVNAKPINKTEPYSEDNSKINTYTATYHGDFAIEISTVYECLEGGTGWYNGIFYDEQERFYTVENTKLYYKGEEIRLVARSCKAKPALNFNNTDSLFYVFTFDTPAVIYSNSSSIYSGFYLWYDKGGYLNCNGWGEISQ